MREIPQVRQLGVHFDQVAYFVIAEAELADGLHQRQAQRNAAAVADCIPAFLDYLAHQATTVFQAAAILVAALIGSRGEKMLEHTVAMRGIETDEIEAGRFRAQTGVAVPATQITNIFSGHGARADRVAGVGANRHGRRRQRNLLGIQVRTVDPGIGQLRAREGIKFVDCIRHFSQDRQIVVIPQTQLDIRRDLRSMVHFILLGEDDAPAALSLDAAHSGRSRGVAIAATVAMWHLVKSVPGGYRSNLHGFEQNIVTWISRHDSPPRRPYSFVIPGIFSVLICA